MMDLHCHIDLYSNPNSVVESCRLHKLFVVSVTTTPAAFPGTASLPSEGDQIETALGLHPQLAGQRFREVDLFDEYLSRAKWVGEVGLDGSPEHKASWQRQVQVFEHILRSCTSLGSRLMSIHSRGAAPGVLELLRRYPGAGIPVLHWFSGNVSDLEAALGFGCWFSVGLPMLRSKKGKAIVDRIPRDRILTETDGPFVELNGKPMHPWEVSIVEQELASIWSTAVEETRQTLHENLVNLKREPTP
jgi:TatD DNase family protein